MTDVGRSPSGSGSRPSDGAASVSTVPASIPNAAKWQLFFEDDGEKLGVSYDLHADYFSDVVQISQWESCDRVVYIDFADLRWLADRLIDAASAIEARRAETTQIGSVHESAVAEGQTPNLSGQGSSHDA